MQRRRRLGDDGHFCVTGSPCCSHGKAGRNKSKVAVNCLAKGTIQALRIQRLKPDGIDRHDPKDDPPPMLIQEKCH